MANRRRSKRYPTLEAWRLSTNLSQRAAASLFGISQVHWSRLERRLQHPRPQLAKHLRDVTGVPADVLLGIDDRKRRTA